MEYILTGKQMKAADLYTIQQIGIPSMVLMERAALQIVEVMEQEALDLSEILILCGSGNNGGDGYAVARLLYLKGWRVEIGFVGKEESRSEENKRQKEIAAYYGIPMYDLLQDIEALKSVKEKEYSVILDGIFGTGLTREITGNYAEILSQVNQKSGVKVAIDIPSGIHDTDGKVMGAAFRADVTVAIAFKKRGLVLYPGAEYAGKICMADIGITENAVFTDDVLTKAYQPCDLKKLIPERKPDSHKGTYGKVLMIVGSAGMSGAAYLSARTAYAIGAGLVQIYTAEENRVILQQLLPEAIIATYKTYDEMQLRKLLAWADVILIGCGLGTEETAVRLVEQTIRERNCPCIVDADALNILSENMGWLKNRCENLVFTPHMKEMSRLWKCSVSELAEQKEKYFMDFLEMYPVVCVLKDARTWTGHHGKEVYLNLSGNEAMAKAGSGDVLAGMITGLAAQKQSLFEAASVGAYLHGLAGDEARAKKGSHSVLARDLIEEISEVLKKI